MNMDENIDNSQVAAAVLNNSTVESVPECPVALLSSSNCSKLPASGLSDKEKNGADSGDGGSLKCEKSTALTSSLSASTSSLCSTSMGENTQLHPSVPQQQQPQRQQQQQQKHQKQQQQLAQSEEVERAAAQHPQGRPMLHIVLLYIIIILQFSLFITELITDQFIHSLLILTDSYHHLFNCCNAVLLLVCCKISDQVTVKNTFGWVRLELLGLLTTMTFIFALIFSLLIEGVLQIVHLHEIATPTNVKILGGFGCASMFVNALQVFIVNRSITAKDKIPSRGQRTFSLAECSPDPVGASDGICLKVLSLEQSNAVVEIQEPSIEHKNEEKKFQNILPQTALDRRASLNVSLGPISASKTEQCSTFGLIVQGIASPTLLLLGALGIFLLQKHELVQITDPVLGIAAALLLCISFFPQLKSTTLILMQTIPENINIVRMKCEILAKFAVIHNVHEVHVWRLTAENVVATCHIVLPSMTATEYSSLFSELRDFLRAVYNIGYVTIQPEFFDSTPDYDRAASPVAADACLMQCNAGHSSPSAICRQLSCCTSENNEPTIDSVHVDSHSHGHGHSHSHGKHGHGHSHHHRH